MNPRLIWDIQGQCWRVVGYMQAGFEELALTAWFADQPVGLVDKAGNVTVMELLG